MNEEQKRKFKAWMDTTGRIYRDDCRDAWEACLEANKAEEQELGRTASVSEWGERIRDRWSGFPGLTWDYVLAWLVEQGFRVPEEQELEPSPTEMVKRLLEKGWTVEAYPDTDMTFFRSPDGKNRLALSAAYHQAFHRKKKVEVEVWLDSDGEIRVIPSNSDSKGLDPKRVSWGWTKGTATFYVEESGG